MPGYRGLRQVQRLVQMTDTHLACRQQVQQPESYRIGHRLEQFNRFIQSIGDSLLHPHSRIYRDPFQNVNRCYVVDHITACAAGERSQNLSRASWTGAVTDAAVPLVVLQAETGLDPEGGGALVLSHTGEGHGPNSPSGLAHGDRYWGMHPGGANFLFADGSVWFIKELIGFTIFQSLATKAGGEVLSADQF